MKKVAVLQTNYLPWKGYFDLINDVDLFVLYNEVQYTKNDWRNRNKVYSHQGLSWFSVPVEYSLGQTILETRIKTTLPWQVDHWNKIKNAYQKSPFWNDYKDFFYDVYFKKQWFFLAELNNYLIKSIAKDFLNISTEFADSRDFDSEGKNAEKLLSLLLSIGATDYVSGPAAKNYLPEEQFRKAGISVIWKNYSSYPQYCQLNEKFEHGVSILDVLFNCGKDAPFYIWGWRNS